MSSLNLSANGPSISKSYQSIVNAPPPSGPAASSSTYGQWAVFSVSAPLASAFQDLGSKESVLKVQTTGEGELVDLVDEFSDGRIQFAYVKVKDSNSGLPKSALIAWCGEGVPERTKGYFTSHMTAVAKLLHGYHVQITARSDRDLTPEGIIRKVADASGSKYSNSSNAPPPLAAATKPSSANKPAFTPTQSTGGSTGYNPIATRTSRKADPSTDEDGWGQDAPPVTRSQLEKVQPAYKPTQVNMRELTAQKPATSASNNDSMAHDTAPGVIRGAYQPVGKVDIAAIRRQAKESGNGNTDRPEIVKGSYEPIGRVDIAAIRAKAQKPDTSTSIPRSTTGQSQEGDESVPSLAERSAAFSSGPERLTSMPKPKIANKFGGTSNFTGTRAPLPGGPDSKSPAPAAPVGTASRTFADQGGKTPAQVWAEKKARERGISGSGNALPPSNTAGQSPVAQQKSGGQWESGYSGKKWGSVPTTHTGQSRGSSIAAQQTGDPDPIPDDDTASPSGGIGSIRDRFAGAAPMGAPAAAGYDRAAPSPAPEPETSTKPNRGLPMPGMFPTAAAPANDEEEEEEAPSAPSLPTPPLQPRSPTPPTPEARDISPIRVAVPVSKTQVADVHEEQYSPAPAFPAKSLDRVISQEDDEPETGPDPGRAAAQAAVTSSLGHEVADATSAEGSGERARAEYDYDAAEGNEVSLREGEIVTDIQKIDPDWWLVTNAQGQNGLVPSNYLVPIEDDTTSASEHATTTHPAVTSTSAAPTTTSSHAAASKGPSAVAEYDYEAGEDNELSFPEGATITNIEFPDDDWWHGEYHGQSGLFPAAYVKINE